MHCRIASCPCNCKTWQGDRLACCPALQQCYLHTAGGLSSLCHVTVVLLCGSTAGNSCAQVQLCHQADCPSSVMKVCPRLEHCLGRAVGTTLQASEQQGVCSHCECCCMARAAVHGCVAKAMLTHTSRKTRSGQGRYCQGQQRTTPQKWACEVNKSRPLSAKDWGWACLKSAASCTEK